VTFSEKTRQVAKDLALDDPAVVQGMYIFKQPKIGTEGEPNIFKPIWRSGGKNVSIVYLF
jgi:hypothetical protein